jgi:hypothetical protein
MFERSFGANIIGQCRRIIEQRERREMIAPAPIIAPEFTNLPHATARAPAAQPRPAPPERALSFPPVSKWGALLHANLGSLFVAD